MKNIYPMQQISSRYVLLNRISSLYSDFPNEPQMVMAGEEISSLDSLRLTFVTWGLSIYFVVQQTLW